MIAHSQISSFSFSRSWCTVPNSKIDLFVPELNSLGCERKQHREPRLECTGETGESTVFQEPASGTDLERDSLVVRNSWEQP